MTKISVTISDEALEDLRTLAAEQNLTFRAAVEQSIQTMKFLHDDMKNGSNLVLEKPNGKLARIIWSVPC